MKLKPYIAFAILFIIYAEIDIHASGIFAPFGIPAFSNTYFAIWESLALLFAIFLGLKFKSYALGFSFLLLARNGTEDWLYYALQFQRPPSLLPWLHTWLPTYSVATPFSLDLAVLWGLGAMLFLAYMETILPRYTSIIKASLLNRKTLYQLIGYALVGIMEWGFGYVIFSHLTLIPAFAAFGVQSVFVGSLAFLLRKFFVFKS